MCPPLAPAFSSLTYQRCLLRDDKSIRPHKQPFTRRRSYIQRASSILSLLCSSEQLIVNKALSSSPPPSHPFPSPPFHQPSAAQREPGKERFDLHSLSGKEREEAERNPASREMQCYTGKVSPTAWIGGGPGMHSEMHTDVLRRQHAAEGWLILEGSTLSRVNG